MHYFIFICDNVAIYNFVFDITFVWNNFSKMLRKNNVMSIDSFYAFKYDFWISGRAGKIGLSF